MKNTKKLKQILVTTALVTVGILAIGGTSSQAALQANPTTHSSGKKATGASWIQSIREMEKSGQTMGLNETIGTNLVATSSSNNIDVHMMRTTEYGAMAILSASGFGWSGKLADAPVKSTTGNVTGVYVPGTRWEWTAGVCSAATVGKDARYYDLYGSNQTSAKVGDALGLDTYTTNPGCSGWHGGYANWLNTTEYGFVRGGIYNSGSGMFSFGDYYWNYSDRANCGRGVAVVGTGL